MRHSPPLRRAGSPRPLVAVDPLLVVQDLGQGAATSVQGRCRGSRTAPAPGPPRCAHAQRCDGGVVDSPACAVLAARPASGKTSLMSQLIVHMLQHHQRMRPPRIFHVDRVLRPFSLHEVRAQPTLSRPYHTLMTTRLLIDHYLITASSIGERAVDALSVQDVGRAGFRR